MLSVGQRVLVHQSGGIKFTDQGMVEIPHDHSDPKQHWESRVLGWDDFHQCPVIATRLYPGTNGKVNPNHAEWSYSEDSLTLLEGEDWADKSSYKPGMKVKFVWMNDIHFPQGTTVEGTIQVAHIAPGDWYVGVEVPDRGGFRDELGKPIKPEPGSTWTFKLVVNEKEFV